MAPVFDYTPGVGAVPPPTRELLLVAQRLSQEYDGRVPPDLVVRCIGAARDGIRWLCADEAELLPTLEAVVRHHLDQIAAP